jgi:hypothetical protein
MIIKSESTRATPPLNFYLLFLFSDANVILNLGSPRRTFLDQIGQVLKKGQVQSIRIRRACMRNLMKVEEAKGVCKDRSKWKEVISAYPNGKRAYVRILNPKYVPTLLCFWDKNRVSIVLIEDWLYDWLYVNIHKHRSRCIPEVVAETSQIFLRDAHVLPKLLSHEDRHDKW